MSSPCSKSGIECDTIQLIEPDSSLPVGVAGGTADPSLTERGEYALAEGEVDVQILFETQKMTANFRYEYLYVDTIAAGIVLNPGVISCVPIVQTVEGFALRLAGAPIHEGYTIRWRVVVVDLQNVPTIDVPEQFNVDIPINADVQTVFFSSPRSHAGFGFSELRVENLDDPAAEQTPILACCVSKNITFFSVAYSPRPPTANYKLIARVP